MIDVVIIGSGPGGYYCAEKVAEDGGKVVVVEKDKLGGICTNYGCIPTKTLHASASVYSDVASATKFGIAVSSFRADFGAIMKRKARISTIMSLGIKKILDSHNVEIVQGTGRIKDKNTVVVGDHEFKTKNIVIATGGKPIVPEGFEINKVVLTSRELLELDKLPHSLVIVGGGYIGCEFASIFSTLGTKVTIVEATDRIVPGEDKEVSDALTRIMERQSIQIMTQRTCKRIEGNKVYLDGDVVEADRVLIAIGVASNFDHEEMDRLGIKYDKGIVVNSKMQTSVENIYAVGDVTEGVKLAHYAYAQAEVAAANICGERREFDNKVVPSVIFTLPEIASVGTRDATLAQATAYFAASGKARSMEQAEGFVKVYHADGYIKGFSAIGPHVSDLVAEAALAIRNNLTLQEIAQTIHVHPTLAETFLDAVKIALRGDFKIPS